MKNNLLYFSFLPVAAVITLAIMAIPILFMLGFATVSEFIFHLFR